MSDHYVVATFFTTAENIFFSVTTRGSFEVKSYNDDILTNVTRVIFYSAFQGFVG